MAKPEDPKKKGSFGIARLPVALQYVFPDRRRAMMRLGGVACLALLLYFLADFFLLKSNFTASGPVSTYHATFEKDCKKCHDTKTREVTDENCSVCHEKAGAKADSVMLTAAQTVYTFDSHYLYRSMDLSRVPSKMQEYGGRQMPCYACHPEHMGRQARITNVPDNRCLDCHKYGSFNKNHPEFDVIAGITPDDTLLSVADDSTLKFTHIKHIITYVPKIRKEVDVERVCLYCHNPRPDGKSFQPIEFDAHCSGSKCHINDPISDLPIRNGGNSVGVETLETIRNRRGVGTQWATYMNPRIFQISDGTTVSKQIIEHEDPWVTENLKRLRRQLYPNQEFAELQKTSGQLASQNDQALTATVYQEALQSLQTYADGLRSRLEPEIQDDLDRVEAQIKKAQRMFRDQMNAGAGAQFMPDPAAAMPNPEIEELVSNLTSVCQKCHVVDKASIQRVAKDQRVLRRAEFDHRAHILDRRCLECHIEIPILRAPGDTTKVNNLAYGAAIQNVPGIENCRECHNSSQSSNRCVTCHYFHPNKTNRSSLLLYLD